MKGLLLACSVLASTPLPAQSGSAAGAPARRQVLDEVMTRFAAFGFSGTVLVAERGSVLLHKGYGFADRGRRIPNTTATVFAFASVTKGFTAAAIYQLEAQGRLNTAAPIGKYLARVPASAAAITVLQLLTHSSGIPHEADDAGGATPDEYVARVLRLPLQSAPGTRYSYSNAGYGLLGAIVERVSGQTYESYVRDNLLRPAGLLHTGWRSDFRSRQLARGYQELYRDAASEITFPAFGSWFMVGTAEDLYKWSEALYTDAVLPAAARKKLFAPAFDEYVNGWWATRTSQGLEVQFTDGDFPGYQMQMGRYPTRHLTIVLAMNNDAGWANLVHKTLRDIVLGERFEPPPRVRSIAQAQLDRLSGRYELASGGAVEARVADGGLLVSATGQEAISALAGVDSVVNARLVERSDLAREFVEHLKLGEFEWIKPMSEFQAPEPYQRLRGFWGRMIETKGQLRGYQVLGTSPSRGALTLTSIRFDLERGSEYWMLWWWDKKLRGWDIDITPPSPTLFRAVSSSDFASLDIKTGRVSRIRFDETGGLLSIPTSLAGQVVARKVK